MENACIDSEVGEKLHIFAGAFADLYYRRLFQCVDTVKRVATSGNIKPNSQLTVTVNDDVGTLHLVSGDTIVAAGVSPRGPELLLGSSMQPWARDIDSYSPHSSSYPCQNLDS